MRLTLLSLPLLALVSSQAIWSTGDGAKYAGCTEYDEEYDIIPNETITSAIVTSDVVDLSTGDHNVFGEIGVFHICTKLETVRLPESLRKIGVSAFDGCKALVHVDIPSGVNEIGEFAFSGSSLETVTIPEGVVNLPRSVFCHCYSLKSVKLPTSLKTIGGSAFYDCSALTTINDDALKGVAEIGRQAFHCCSSLTTFKLPPLLKTIESYTFNGCESLSKVELPPYLETIKNYAFHGCHSDLIIDLPEAVRNIGELALYDSRIRLPPSLSMLTNGGNAAGLLHKVKEVVMSSRVDLVLLVDYINSVKSQMYFADDLKFKVLYSGFTSTTTFSAKEHMHSSYFSFDLSIEELKKIGAHSLHCKVHAAFAKKVSIYAAILQCKNFHLPKDVLYVILPFLHGEMLTKVMLKEIVTEAGKMLGSPTQEGKK